MGLAVSATGEIRAAPPENPERMVAVWFAVHSCRSIRWAFHVMTLPTTVRRGHDSLRFARYPTDAIARPGVRNRNRIMFPSGSFPYNEANRHRVAHLLLRVGEVMIGADKILRVSSGFPCPKDMGNPPASGR